MRNDAKFVVAEPCCTEAKVLVHNHNLKIIKSGSRNTV